MIIPFIRTALLYIIVIFALRLMGKRQICELQPSELVVTLLISNIASMPMQETGIPLLTGIIPILTLVSLEIIVSFLMIKSNLFRRIISGKPVIIIKDGKIIQNELKNVRFSIEDIFEELRLQKIDKIDDISCGIVEANGKLSIFLKPYALPCTPKDLNIQTEDNGVSLVVISDGIISDRVMTTLNIDIDWVNSVLHKRNLSAKDVFLMTANKSYDYYILEKEKKN